MKHFLIFIIFLIHQPNVALSDSIETFQDQISQIDIKITQLQIEKQTLQEHLLSLQVKTTKAPCWTDPLLGIKFVWVEGGCFKMGDRLDIGDDDEKPSHNVCVDGYYIGTYEITQSQYVKVMRKNPSAIKNSNKAYPVESISWKSTQLFINKLNKYSKVKFRLPTEAEWEIAARSGNERHRYAGSDDAEKVAWGQHNDAGYIKVVGQKEPNSLGIYDMTGNVAEWCSDWYTPNYYNSALIDNPTGPSKGQHKVFRGGSFKSFRHQLRIANRNSTNPQNKLDFVGFRLAYTP